MGDWVIEEQRGLSEGRLVEIRELALTCEQHDGLRLKLNWDMLEARPPEETNDFLCRSGDELIGFLGLYGFGREELELNGMVHPAFRRRGVFRQLVAAAQAECARRGVPQLLFVCDRASNSGAACLRRLGARYSVSEYAMELTGKPPLPDRRSALEVRAAALEDLPHFAELDAECFGRSLERAALSAERLRKPNYRGYLCLHDGEAVGKTLVALEDESAFVYGLCVRPAQQGRGFGRALLGEAIRRTRAESTLPIRLEVACENPRALQLYQSCGFQATATYDYYELPVASAPLAEPGPVAT